MAISFKRYVDIVSGVGGDSPVATRALIGRIFTTNPLVPTKSFLEFDSADDVGSYFGTASEEYLRAVFYFSFISKNVTRAPKISYARWASANVAPLIYGKVTGNLLAAFTSIVAGSLVLTLGANSATLSGINLSGASDLAGVAAIIQSAVRAQSGFGSQWTAATVTYNATRGSFNLVGGTTGAAVVAVAEGAQALAATLGWLDGAIFSNGAVAESVTDTLKASAAASNNFGSFLFMPTLTLQQVTDSANWNKTQNVSFQFCQAVAAVNAAGWNAALIAIAGVSLTLDPLTTEYPEMAPMILLAATDYSQRNATQNYMYQQFPLTPSVTTDADADTYDNLRVNYYGNTQSAGRTISFYQRGVLMGLSVDPVDMNTYANEQWLKDAAGVGILSLLLVLPKVGANASGRASVLSVLQTIADTGVFNGTISVGKDLDTDQQLFITEKTGDARAWRQVQTIGYWYDAVIAPFTTSDNRTEYRVDYTLVYSKDDTVRKVDGSHVLI